MTKPRDIHRGRDAEAAADREPEVRPEVIQDLDMPDDEDIIGGGNRTCQPGTCGHAEYTFNTN
jgi:hypothetical protein